MTQTLPDRTFDYRARWGWVLGSIILFGACAPVLRWQATQGRGLILDRLVELPPRQALVLLSFLALASLAFVLIAGFLALARLFNPQRFVFTASALHVPSRPWSRTPRAIHYADMQAIKVVEIMGQCILRITRKSGRQEVLASMLPSRDAFEDLRRELLRRAVPATQPAA